MRLVSSILLLLILSTSSDVLAQGKYTPVTKGPNDTRALIVLVGGASDSKLGFVRQNLYTHLKGYQKFMPGLRLEYRTWTSRGGGPSGGPDEIARTIIQQRAEWQRLGIPASKTRVIIIGHSYGAGTGIYGAKRLIAKKQPDIDAVITLDAVSRTDVRRGAPNAKYWLHVFADNSGGWNNSVVATLGGHWGNMPLADRSIKAKRGTDHVDVVGMFQYVKDDVWDVLNGNRPRSLARRFDKSNPPPAGSKSKDYGFTHRRVSDDAIKFSKNYGVPGNARLAGFAVLEQKTLRTESGPTYTVDTKKNLVNVKARHKKRDWWQDRNKGPYVTVKLRVYYHERPVGFNLIGNEDYQSLSKFKSIGEVSGWGHKSKRSISFVSVGKASDGKPTWGMVTDGAKFSKNKHEIYTVISSRMDKKFGLTITLESKKHKKNPDVPYRILLRSGDAVQYCHFEGDKYAESPMGKGTFIKSNTPPPNVTPKISPTPEVRPNTKPRFGVRLEKVPNQSGLVIREVQPDSPGTRVAIQEAVFSLEVGDYLESINGKALNSINDYRDAVTQSGSRMQITVRDRNSGRTVKGIVQLGGAAAKPAGNSTGNSSNNSTPAAKPRFGVRLEKVANQTGLVIREVQAGSPGQRFVTDQGVFALEVGDYLESINGVDVNSLEDYRKAVTTSGKEMRITVRDRNSGESVGGVVQLRSDQ